MQVSYQVKRSQHSCVGANYLPSYQVKLPTQLGWSKLPSRLPGETLPTQLRWSKLPSKLPGETLPTQLRWSKLPSKLPGETLPAQLRWSKLASKPSGETLPTQLRWSKLASRLPGEIYYTVSMFTYTSYSQRSTILPNRTTAIVRVHISDYIAQNRTTLQ